jgi:hypothetical protein
MTMKMYAQHTLRNTAGLWALLFALVMMAAAPTNAVAQHAPAAAASVTAECPHHAAHHVGDDGPAAHAAHANGAFAGMPAADCPMRNDCPMMQGEHAAHPRHEECPMMQASDQARSEPGTHAAHAAAGRGDDVRVLKLTAGPTGFDPNQLELEAGVPVRLVVTRTTPSRCLEEIMIPALGVEKTPLPLNQPVTIDLAPAESGRFTFACGMDMLQGTLVVNP